MKENSKNLTFTIPNILTLLRLLLIPLFIWLYGFKSNYPLALVVLFVSGLSDVLDGYIARNFDQVSSLGKILDPFADKLTQAAVVFCLLKTPYIESVHMLSLFIFLIIKDLIIATLGFLVMKKRNFITGSFWYGKLAALSLYIMMIIHIIWIDIPSRLSLGLIFGCFFFMLLAFILYLILYIKLLLKQENIK